MNRIRPYLVWMFLAAFVAFYAFTDFWPGRGDSDFYDVPPYYLALSQAAICVAQSQNDNESNQPSKPDKPKVGDKCQVCNGSGNSPDPAIDRCPNCNGTGKVQAATQKAGCENPECECENCECDPCECKKTTKPSSLGGGSRSGRTADDSLTQVVESALSQNSPATDKPVENPVPLTTGSVARRNIQWVAIRGDDKLRELRKQAEKEKKNLVVVFASKADCPGCIIQDRDVFQSESVAKYLNENCLIVYVDCNRYEDLAKVWCVTDDIKIPAKPSTVVVKQDGTLRRVGVGLITEEKFLQFLRTSIEELEK